MQTKPRQSNIELLRILAMLLIVAHHFALHSGFAFPTETVTLNRLWVQLLRMGGKIGVDVFVLISGWFLISAPAVRTKKALTLWAQIFFYSVAIYAVLALAGLVPISTKDAVKRLAPIATEQWWFATAYLLLCLFAPYLNALLHSLTRRAYRGLLALTLTLWCVIPTLTTLEIAWSDLLWFFTLYALAGYLKRFSVAESVSAKKLLGAAALTALATYLTAVAADIVGMKVALVGEKAHFFFRDMTSLPVVAIAALLLLGFSKLDLGSRKWLNILASATFGVYLIHDDAFVRPLLWQHTADYAETPLLVPYSLFVIAAVYFGCTAVELLRIYLIEKPLSPLFEKLATRLDAKKNTLLGE